MVIFILAWSDFSIVKKHFQFSNGSESKPSTICTFKRGKCDFHHNPIITTRYLELEIIILSNSISKYIRYIRYITHLLMRSLCVHAVPCPTRPLLGWAMLDFAGGISALLDTGPTAMSHVGFGLRHLCTTRLSKPRHRPRGYRRTAPMRTAFPL